jgi:hypothetical protein
MRLGFPKLTPFSALDVAELTGEVNCFLDDAQVPPVTARAKSKDAALTRAASYVSVRPAL